MQYEPGVFPIANLENAGQRSMQIKGAKSKHYTTNENMYNMSHGIGGYSALAAIFGNEDGSRAQGALYDVQDLAKLYQNKARTLPVTALEQSVGLVTDISGNGNHAYQADPTKRPIVSARYNLLDSTATFASWGKINVSLTEVPWAVSPVRNEKVYQGEITATGVLTYFQAPVFPLQNSATYVRTILAKFIEGTRPFVIFENTDGVATTRTEFNLLTGAITGTLTAGASATKLADDWRLLKLVFTTAATGTPNLRSVFLNTFGPSTGSTVVWLSAPDTRLEADTLLNIPSYQRVNTATDYDSEGFPKYLKGNGTTQFLQTDAIDFTGTDKMTVIAGVHKASDAALGIFCEHGNAVDTLLNAPRFDAAPSYGTDLRGGAATTVSTGPFAAPISNVVGVLLNRAGAAANDQVKVRVNGLLPAQTVHNPGPSTGNFTNNPLYLLARAGTSLFFQGRLYGLAICGKSVNPYPLFLAEEEMGSKMGIELS